MKQAPLSSIVQGGGKRRALRHHVSSVHSRAVSKMTKALGTTNDTNSKNGETLAIFKRCHRLAQSISTGRLAMPSTISG